VYDDVLPFMRELKSRDIKIGIISNCDENTRDLLAELGVAALADALLLSNEVGAANRRLRFTSAHWISSGCPRRPPVLL
jgi:FMN phosphatase YigB (HAD superfamily)